MSAGVSRILRADARENRDRILDVARTLFADRGLDVPMTAVARHAGVGAATLYRRFPTKEALVTEVFADQFTQCAAAVNDALADPTAFPHAVDIESGRDRALAGLAELVRRARASGDLRADVTVDDLVLLLMANRGLVADSADTARAASRRLVGLVLDAMRAARTGSADPLPPPVTLDLLSAGSRRPH